MTEKKTGYNPDAMRGFEEMAKNGKLHGMGVQEEQPFEETMQEGIKETEAALEPPIEYEVPLIDEQESESLTTADIELWKKQFPDCQIYRIPILEQDYVIRTLTRVEYKQIAAREDLNSLTREEMICKTCCLWPQLDAGIIGRGGAGVWSTLSKLILQLSGFTEPDGVERLA